MLTLKNLFYVLVFGVLMYVGIQQALEMGNSRKWPTTEGMITASRITSSYKTSSEKGSRGHHYEYEVDVQYAYEVDGVGYSGNRLRIRPTKYSLEGNAQRELAEYPVGQRVRERSLLKQH